MEQQQPPGFTGAHNLTRLRDLLRRVTEQLPEAKLSPVVEGSFAFNSVTIAFSNGFEVLVAVDADLPEALYEVVRFVSPRDVHLYAFETRRTLGAAYSDKLSGDAVLAVLKQYALLPTARPDK